MRLAIITAMILLTSCATINHEPKIPMNERMLLPEVSDMYNEEAKRVDNIDLRDTEKEVNNSKEVIDEVVYSEPEEKYSLKFSGDIRGALRAFALEYGTNMTIASDVVGSVEIDLHDVDFKTAMDSILSSVGAWWHVSNGVLEVSLSEARMFEINYFDISRTIAVTGSQSNSSSGSSGGTSSGTSSGSSTGSSTGSTNGSGSASSGNSSITSDKTVDFWGSLDGQLRPLLTNNGTLVINPISGIVFIKDKHANVELIADFIKNIENSISRQVLLEVKIYDITLNDNTSLGIDWSVVQNNAAGAFGITSTLNGIASGIISGNYKNQVGVSSSAMINALRTQGSIKTISNPKVIALNNQPAVIKNIVSQPYFTTTTLTGTISNPTQTNESIRFTEIGLDLSMLAKIGADSSVTLSVTPTLTGSIGEAVGNGGTKAPITDVKSANTTARVNDGDTLIIGGIIREYYEINHRMVPLLGEIPLIGLPLNGKITKKERRELVIFVTPKIIRGK